MHIHFRVSFQHFQILISFQLHFKSLLLDTLYGDFNVSQFDILHTLPFSTYVLRLLSFL